MEYKPIKLSRIRLILNLIPTNIFKLVNKIFCIIWKNNFLVEFNK